MDVGRGLLNGDLRVRLLDVLLELRFDPPGELVERLLDLRDLRLGVLQFLPDWQARPLA